MIFVASKKSFEKVQFLPDKKLKKDEFYLFIFCKLQYLNKGYM